uniref:Ubiquitin-like domain-containing protein n=1 Tax=Tanacetum cinerariifolium TaxID=118510 RepID=A0A6L2JXV6_TANCI|nr:hypothetical protein [Tanacetum cinerariifolium]
MVRVSTGSQWHDISIQATATFGDMKMVLALVTGMEPKEQRLLFKGKERDDDEHLHMVGVRDKDKVVVLEDPAIKEMKLHGSLATTSDIGASNHAIIVRMKALLEQQGLVAALEELPTATIVAFDNVIRKKAFSTLILCLGDRWDSLKLEDVLATFNSRELHNDGSKGNKDQVSGSAADGYYSADVMMAMSVEELLDWIMDSGGSYHTTHRRDYLVDFNEYDGDNILLGDGKECRVRGTRLLIRGFVGRPMRFLGFASWDFGQGHMGELTNKEIRNSNAYKEYYAIATGAAPPKPKASVRRTRSSTDTSITPLTATADEGTGSIPGIHDVPTDESEEELSWNSTDDEGDDDEKDGDSDDDNNGDDDEEDDGEEGNGDNDDEDDNGEEGGDDGDDQEVVRDDDKDDEKDYEKEGGDDEQEYDEEEYDEETRDEESFDPISKTPENNNDEGNGDEDLGLNVGGEERHVEEEQEDELYGDVNINQGMGLQTTLEVEDTHVTLTPVNPEGQQQSSSVNDEGNGDEDLGLNVGGEERHVEEEPEDELYGDVNINQGMGLQTTLEVEDTHVTLTPVNPEGQQQSSSVSSQFMTSMLNPTLDVAKVVVPIQSDRLRDIGQRENEEFLKTIDENMQKIIKEQVKEQVKVQVSKILPRIEQTVNEQLEAEVLTRSSHSSKTSYVVVADLSEMELKKILIKKMEGNKSIQRSDEQRNLYKALVESYKSDKIILETYEETVTLKRRRDDDADKDEEPSAGPDRGSKRRREGKEPESASAPTETSTRSAGRSTQGSQSRQASASLSAFIEKPVHTTCQMEEPSHLEFDTELEYHLKEVFKATTDQLDWVNPEGQQYLHNLLKPLPLIPNNRGRRVIPFEHFINNDLEYLRGGASSRKYTTSITKTKAADYGHIKWIEDLQFYDFAINRESAYDVYSKRRIIAITELKIVEWYNYKHLDWITVRRDNDKLYKFKEGNSKRLRIQDIEDMLLLLVQGKLTNLTVDKHFAFNVSLRMFTRSIIIQRRVEDLQLGVESYQKKLNLPKPDSYRSDLKCKEAYIAYSNPRGFIYQNKDKKNRLMWIDELHKFSDETLTDVRTALDDRLKGIWMQYLPQSIWRKSDKDRAAAIIQAIDKRLKTRRIMRSLERFIGGRLWVPIGKSNYYLDVEKSQSNLIYKIAMDILKHTNFFKLSLLPQPYHPSIFSNYGILFDMTRPLGVTSVLDEQWFNLTKDTLRDALQITPVNNNQAFTSPSSSDALINFINELGYPKLVRNLSNVVTNDMFQPWRALTTIINLCLTRKTSGFERPRALVLQILWGVVNRAHLDYAKRIWEEFTQSIHTFIKDKKNLAQHTHGKKKATLIVIPSFRYLKSSTKGTKREVFGMPILGNLITADIQGESYYQEYLEKVAKHKRYMAGETGSDSDSPVPKPTKTAKKFKLTALKADPRPPVSKPASSQQPKPKPAPAKSQGKKRKLVTEISDKPSQARKIRPSIVSKQRKPISSLRSGIEGKLKEYIRCAWGPFSPVVIREPESKKYQPLLEVPGKGKEKVNEEQVSDNLLTLQMPKKKSPGDRYIFQRRTSIPTGSSGHDESSLLYARPNPNAQDEGQAGPNPDEHAEGHIGPNPGDAEASQPLPSLVVHAGSDLEHMDLDVADVSTQPHPEQIDEGFTATAYPKNVGKQSYKNHEDHMQLYEALEKFMNRDHSEELVKDLAEARQKKKKRNDLQKMPHGSPPHQPPPPPLPTGPSRASGSPSASGSSQVPPSPPPPPFTNQEDIQINDDMAPDAQAQSSDDEDIGNSYIPKVNLRQDWWKPLEVERPATPEPAWSIPSSNIGDIAMFMDWFCKRQGIIELKPQDLEGPVFELVKVFYPNVIHLQYQMEECYKLLTNSMGDSILRHNVSKPLPLGSPPGQVTIQSNFFFNKDLEYLRDSSKGSRPALSISKMKVAYYPDVGLEKMVPDQMWIEEECKYDVVAIIKVFSMYGYDYMKKIVLRRADLNEHVIAKRDFKYLYPSDFEDLYLLNLQEDFQLGIESYQTQLNLTKPQWDATGFEYKHDYTVIDSPRAVTFQDRYGVQMIMRFNEIHKFSDGTLQHIDEALDYRVKEFKINMINQGLNIRFWTRKDVDRSKEFMFAIQNG